MRVDRSARITFVIIPRSKRSGMYWFTSVKIIVTQSQLLEIWYQASTWWVVPYDTFSGLSVVYFLFVKHNVHIIQNFVTLSWLFSTATHQSFLIFVRISFSYIQMGCTMWPPPRWCKGQHVYLQCRRFWDGFPVGSKLKIAASLLNMQH